MAEGIPADNFLDDHMGTVVVDSNSDQDEAGCSTDQEAYDTANTYTDPEEQRTIFICPHCNKHFQQLCNLKQHMRIHSGDRPFMCSFCHKRFKQQGHLQTHERSIHTGERPFACPVETCSSSFHQLGNLNGHIRRCHKPKSTLPKPRPKKSKIRYPCRCGSVYLSKGALRNHYRKMHEESLVEEDGVIGPGSSVVFKSESSLSLNLKQKDPDFTQGLDQQCSNNVEQRINLIQSGDSGPPKVLRIVIVRQSSAAIENATQEQEGDIESLPPDGDASNSSDGFGTDDFMSNYFT